MTKTNDKASRARRAEQAQERQVAHDKLTNDQKIEKAKSRPGSSTREIRRLKGLRESDRNYETKLLANPEAVAALDNGMEQLKQGKGEKATRRRKRSTE